MRANELAERLAQQAENVAAYLLPNGKREGSEWVCGDIQGNAGKSLKVCIAGSKAGVWKDFADDKGGDLLSLWCESRSISIGEAMDEVRSYLGVEITNVERDKPIAPVATPQADPVSKYLLDRGISEATQARYMVGAVGGEVYFPSYIEKAVVWAKYRSISDKSKMRVEKGGTPVLFGWQAIPKKQRSVVICEGEIDALSWFQLGYPALSVPNGAQGFNWLETEYNRLERFDKIYIAFDTDEAGRKGALDLIERLGVERCLLVDTENFKDANEIVKAGGDAKRFIQNATWQDPEELKLASEFRGEVVDSFVNGLDSEPAFDSPFSKLKDLLRFRINELTILSGVNGHGKSQLSGQMILSAIGQGWKPVIYSGEMKPRRFLNKMVIQAGADNEPSIQKVGSVMDWLGDKLHVFNLTKSAKTSRLIEVFEYAHKRYGSNLFVIDSLAMCGISEDDYNGQKKFIEQLCDFRNTYPIHILLLAHARKAQDENRTTGKMDIKGTGAITDLVDTVLTLWRNKPKENAKFQDEEQYQEKYVHEPDALLTCSKQRNGDWEGVAKVWWRKRANQFVEADRGEAQPYYSHLRAV